MAHRSDPPVDAPSCFRLRQRTDADMDALAELWAASWLEAMPGIDFAARTTWLRGHLPALEAAGAVTVCGFDEAGRLLGFATVDPQNGYLDQITVAPEAKSSGAASALLAEARRISEHPLFLDVNQDNPRALRFYAREGFRTVEAGVNPRSGLKTWRLREA
jgi:putative acetyltransferase